MSAYMTSIPPLPDLVLSPPSVQARLEDEPDTTVRDDAGNVWSQHYLKRSQQVLRFPGLADFFVPVTDDAVRVIATPETDERTVRMLWSTQVVPLLRTRQPGVVLHGCAVQLNQTAIAFLGASGAGKSTLSAYLAAHGLPSLSDDTLWVRSQAGKPVVLPAEATIRLWKDSEDALRAADGARRLPDVSYTSKGQFALGERFAHCDKTLPLSAIFVLSKHDVPAPIIVRREAGAGLTDIVQHSFLLDRNDPVARRAHFESIATLAASVPVFSFDYPRRYDALENARTAILSYANETRPSAASCGV